MRHTGHRRHPVSFQLYFPLKGDRPYVQSDVRAPETDVLDVTYAAVVVKTLFCEQNCTTILSRGKTYTSSLPAMGSLSFSRVITAVGTKTVSSSKIRNNSLKIADACKLPYVWSLFNDGVHFFSPMIVSSFGPVSIFGTEIGDRKAVEKSYQNVENIDLRHKHIPQLMHGYGACLNLTLAALRIEKI